MRPAFPQKWRRIGWVLLDPLPIASAASLCLGCLLAYRVHHWIVRLPPAYGWWYAVRHENYPPDLLLMVVLLAVIAPACALAWGERLLDRIRFGSNFVDTYTPLRHRKHQIIERTRANLCPTCGYDIRQSSLTCPECGGPIRRLPTTPPARSAPGVEKASTSVRVRRAS